MSPPASSENRGSECGRPRSPEPTPPAGQISRALGPGVLEAVPGESAHHGGEQACEGEGGDMAGDDDVGWGDGVPIAARFLTFHRSKVCQWSAVAAPLDACAGGWFSSGRYRCFWARFTAAGPEEEGDRRRSEPSAGPFSPVVLTPPAADGNT